MTSRPDQKRRSRHFQIEQRARLTEFVGLLSVWLSSVCGCLRVYECVAPTQSPSELRRVLKRARAIDDDTSVRARRVVLYGHPKPEPQLQRRTKEMTPRTSPLRTQNRPTTLMVTWAVAGALRGRQVTADAVSCDIELLTTCVSLSPWVPPELSRMHERLLGHAHTAALFT